MVPAPSCPIAWDYWTATPSDYVELTCLMPNSIFLSLRVSWNATLLGVKEELWDLAMKQPLFGMLREMSGYVFQFINSLAVPEEVDDENKRLRDIKPALGVLMIIERSIQRPGENLLNTQISHLIGKGLNEFDNLRSSEVNDFRMRMRYLAEESLLKRAQSTQLERLRYHCPPRLADLHTVPTSLHSHLNNNCFILVTKVAKTEWQFSRKVNEQQNHSVAFPEYCRMWGSYLIRMENKQFSIFALPCKSSMIIYRPKKYL
ncbi:jg5657 [Pararge aegeria aegeria]|uniref:Jg5657 protein n=1 Tax=Pararge aegeria aegeria TaxID=348720 RepID=A0A8S4QSL3_9NEOP|nr:jg5657 [Pararge aegeria aegeria]